MSVPPAWPTRHHPGNQVHWNRHLFLLGFTHDCIVSVDPRMSNLSKIPGVSKEHSWKLVFKYCFGTHFFGLQVFSLFTNGKQMKIPFLSAITLLFKGF